MFFLIIIFFEIKFQKFSFRKYLSIRKSDYRFLMKINEGQIQNLPTMHYFIALIAEPILGKLENMHIQM